MKISITGTGHTATATAYALVMRQLADELVLVSRNPASASGVRADGHAQDLLHSSIFFNSRPVVIRAGGIDASDESDIVIVTNSALTTDEGKDDRLAMAGANAEVFRDLIPEIVRRSPRAVLLIVTNPVDVMTYVAMKGCGLPPGRVIGTGTLIDTGRFRALLAARTGIHPTDVRAYILGEHGETMFPLLSLASAGGMRLPETNAHMRQEFERARRGGIEIGKKKGYTDYAIGAAAAMIAGAVAGNTREILPVSTLVDNFHGVSDVCLSLPCVVGRHGVAQVLRPDLDDREIAALHISAARLRGVINGLLD